MGTTVEQCATPSTRRQYPAIGSAPNVHSWTFDVMVKGALHIGGTTAIPLRAVLLRLGLNPQEYTDGEVWIIIA